MINGRGTFVGRSWSSKGFFWKMRKQEINFELF